MTLTGTDSAAAVIIAAFSEVEQGILNLALILLAIFVAMILAIIVALWFERRQRRKTAALMADVKARVDGGVLS